ncbi:MAG: hypothetical protein LBT80_06800 [Lactobacillaceae bacterium]|jgi:hypothetical protein|nr:hypothetical protein [Lactobacillaceae bacterium]
MAKKTQIINFFFYKVYIGNDFSQLKRFSLEDWYTNSLPVEMGDSTEKIGNSTNGQYRNVRISSGIIHVDDFEKQGRLEWLHFTKHTERGVMKSNVSSDEVSTIELKNEEYVALDTNVVFDPNNSFMMIQANRNAVSDQHIQEYINVFLDSDAKINLVPVKVDVRNRLQKVMGFKKLHYKFDAESVLYTNPKEEDPATLKAGFNLMHLTEAYSVEVVLKPKPRSNKYLNEATINAIADEITSNPMQIGKAEVEFDETVSGQKEVLNLLDSVLKYSEKFTHEPKESVPVNEIKKVMMANIKKYEEKAKN